VRRVCWDLREPFSLMLFAIKHNFSHELVTICGR
jgi:hypothetical protein